MAKEITGVGVNQDNGRVETRMLYVFAISPRVVNSNGTEITPYDTNSIPQYLESQLPSGQLAAIDAGDAGYLFTSLTKSAGETSQAFSARVKLDYDELVAFELQRRRDEAVEAGGSDRHRFQLDR